jgi:hypothetical protein
MIKIVDIYKIGAHCPTQWHGKDEATGLWVYFRYRFGGLSATWNSSGEQIIHKTIGGPYSGVMDFEQLKENLKDEFEFACSERLPTREELGEDDET